jgi:hypothetical protein
MHLRYDEDFVEEAVRLCATTRRRVVSSFQVARFNREREKLYGTLDPDERNAAFFRLHLEWFREWGLEALLTRPLEEFPLLPGALNVLAFRKARGKSDDGAELYVNETGDRSGILAMRPERLTRERELGAFLRHELAHLQDMVDSSFGYLPELPIPSPFMSQYRVARERYRLLWDITIDGRLTRRRQHTVATKEQRQAEFAGAFAFWPEARQQEVFEALWTNPAPTHKILADLVCEPRQIQAHAGPQPGAPCPLCGFPTFIWATATSLTDRCVRAIRSEFPFWTPEQGACARCSEIYRLNRPSATIVS